MELNYTDFSPHNLEKKQNFQGICIFWSLSVPDQKYTFISPEVEAVMGYKPIDFYLNPKLWLNLIQNYNTKSTRKLVGDNLYFESSYSMKNIRGDLLSVDEVIYPIFDEKEQLTILQGISKIRFEGSKNDVEFEDSPIPYFVAIKENYNWRVKKITKGLISLFDDYEQFKANYESWIKDFQKIINEKINESKSLKSNKFNYEIELNDNNKIILFEFEQHTIDNNEQIMGWAFDITELKLNEKRLQKLNNDKNKLLSIVSHDLKAPFNTILSFINLLNEGIEIDENQKKEYLKYIYDTTKQQLELIHDLLDWSKVEAGLIEFTPLFLDFNSLLGKVISGFSGQIYQKKIQVVYDFDKDLKVFFDRNYLKIVLSNIISNAIKFSHKKGKIIISAEKEADYTSIIIQDFGIGFSERYFKQLTQSQNFELQIGTMGEKGSGFGLKFCYDIITSNFGKLYLESQSQKGTKIIIKLRNPKVIGIYFGEEEEVKLLKKYSNFIQPDGHLYLCKDIFDFFKFIEETKVDIAFINLDLIKSFQRSFLERVFLELKDVQKIVGFTDHPDEIEDLNSIIKVGEIEKKSKIREKVTEQLKAFLKSSHNNPISKLDNFQNDTLNE